MVAATALLAAAPILPLVLPKRVAAAAGVWLMAACYLSGLVLAVGL